MNHSSCSRSLSVRILVGLLAYALVALPVSAERPPAGYARPPIHVKGNASTSPTGYSPSQILTAYGFNAVTNQGAGQTIAIVDAYDDPNIASDLATFDAQFGIPCNNCFTEIYASGSKPSTNAGWALEISLDVEWAHAIAPQARILLVEAASNSFANLLQAVDIAVKNGASVVSMSWGGSEFSSETSYDSSHFAVNNVTFVASSGDSGNGAEYPAASPYVVGVGGTTLKLTSQSVWSSETAWSGSGGGQSAYEVEPSFQSAYPIPNDSAGKRGIPDVAYDANPNTGVSVYDSVRYQGQKGWFQVGGTSAGAPQWAALFAIANSLRAASGKATLGNTNMALYSAVSSNYHDITSGTNGNCGTLCTAAAGYDYVTGLGSPQAGSIINALAKY